MIHFVLNLATLSFSQVREDLKFYARIDIIEECERVDMDRLSNADDTSKEDVAKSLNEKLAHKVKFYGVQDVDQLTAYCRKFSNQTDKIGLNPKDCSGACQVPSKQQCSVRTGNIKDCDSKDATGFSGPQKKQKANKRH